MNKKLLIVNKVNYHFEIIESIIVKYYEILKIEKNTPIDIYLDVFPNKCFIRYIRNKYPTIKLENLKNYHYYINCTIYDKDFNNLDNNESNKKYISHEITERLKTNPNVFFLTPLAKGNYIYSDVLPYTNNKKISNVPIYIIQGNLNQNRRYVELLIKLINNNYQHNFIIKLVGRGTLPNELLKYKDKIVLKNNLTFTDFHKEFLDAYCILPLISKETHPHYYSTKLTSTINYARGYKLKCLIDKDLQDIYNLENSEVYNDINDITSSFTKTLNEFYTNNKNT